MYFVLRRFFNTHHRHHVPFGGCFMDALALITITDPIIYPGVMILGFDTFLPSFARY
jgi:hypothetical protein